MLQLCTPEMIIDIVHTRVGVPHDTPDLETSSWDELGVDSLGLLEAVSTLERQMGIAIPLQDAQGTRNILELVALANSITV